MNKVMKKSFSAMLALTIVGSGLPAISGGVDLFESAITADAAAIYDIYIAGVRVNTDNAEDILGDGVFSYDGSTDTLTINGDYTNEELGFNYDAGTSLIRTLGDCTIVVAGDSTINIPLSAFICSSANVTLKGPGKLTLDCGVGSYMLSSGIMAVIDSDIVINAHDGWGFAGVASDAYKNCKFYCINSSIDITNDSSEYSVLKNFKSYVYKDCYITNPEEYHFTNFYYCDKDDHYLSEISIRADENRSSVDYDNSDELEFIPGDTDCDCQLGLADLNVLYKAVRDPYDPSVFNRYDEILAHGDVFNKGDGIDYRDVMVLTAWMYNGRIPFYGAIAERTYENEDEVYGELTGDYICNTEHRVLGTSLTLDGGIGVNFYVELDEYVKKAVLSGPEGDTEITDFSSLKQTTGDYKDSYKLTYYVNSNNANEKVKLRLYDENGKQLIIKDHPLMEFSYSINDSIKYYKAHSSSYIPEINELVNKLDTYCKASENYFNGADNTISGVSSIDVFDDFNPYANNTDYLAGCRMALVLNSKTSVRLFYEGEEEMAWLKVYREGELTPSDLYTKKHNDDGDYFEVGRIPAHRLSEIFVVSIGDKNVVFTALSYGFLVKIRSDDEKLKTLCCALYDYAMAAEAYYNTFLD